MCKLGTRKAWFIVLAYPQTSYLTSLSRTLFSNSTNLMGWL